MSQSFPQTLYQGSNYNALGDHRYQSILQISPQMGISILGPMSRMDHLFGLPQVPAEKGAEIPAGQFDRFHPTDPVFKVAALRIYSEEEMPWLSPYQGIRFQAVGFQTSGDAYNRDWSMIGVKSFMEKIRNLGPEGITPDAYLDEDWRRRCATDQLAYAIANKTMDVIIDTDVPDAYGDFKIRTKTAPFIFSHFYRREWGALHPKGAEIKSIQISCATKGYSLLMEIERNSVRMIGEVKTAEWNGEPKFTPLATA